MSIKLIIVLGYTLNSDCSIQPILQARLNKALSLYQQGDEILVCGKMPPKAFMPSRCEKTTEAEMMKNYLIKYHIPAEKIFKEEQSTTTFGNAYYSFQPVLDTELSNEKEEIHQWKTLIQQIVDTCYPLLFAKVKNGDIEAINTAIQSPNKGAFDTCVKKILKLEDTADLSDFIY